MLKRYLIKLKLFIFFKIRGLDCYCFNMVESVFFKLLVDIIF